MSEKTKEPYGDVEYADPGYQSDKKKRYPIDTEEHARSAWSYINKEENASKYSAEDLAKVRAKIKRAAKKHGIDIGDEGSKAKDGGYPYGAGRFDADGYLPDGRHVTELHMSDLSTKELGMKAHEHRKRGEDRKADDCEEEMDKRMSGAHVESKSGEPVECRTAVQLSGVVNNEITFLPAGLHSITPAGGGIGRPITVKIDPTTAAEIEHQRHALQAKGKRPYFDFNHEDGKASFWPHSFIWRSGEGVVACGEWSGSGKEAVKSRDFRAFSPVFYVDNKLGNPAKVVCRESAKPNMGGLVNDPAFSNLPLWAKNDGTSVNAGDNGDNKTRRRNKVSNEEVAALRAKNQELENRLEALRSNPDPTLAEPEIKAAEAERDLNLERIRNAQLESELREKNDAIAAKKDAEADAAVQRLVSAGVILSQDGEARKKYKKILVDDPGFERSAMQSARRDLTTRITSSSVSVTSEDPHKILCKLAELSGRGTKGSIADKMLVAREVAAIYKREVSPITAGERSTRLMGYPLKTVGEALVAGDNTDTNLGILSGTLVTQRVLELLKFTFPSLVSFTTDFTDQPAQYGQTIVTRIVTVPNVVAYSTASGWTDSSAVTTDVPVTINNHKGVPITFNTQILASTVRRLFDEFAEASSYALGKDMVDNLYGNITDANFTNNTVVASASVIRSTLVDLQNALNKRGVPFMGRTCLLWSDAFAALQKDANMQTPYAFFAPEVLKEGQSGPKFVIPLSSFSIIDAPNLPTNNGNVNGFAGSKSALIIVTRPDNDYTSILPGASYGNVAMVTDPDIGMTVTQVQYVNHQLATCTSRISLLYGTAAGQGNAGQLLKANSGSGSSH